MADIPERIDFDPEDLTFDEMEAIEQAAETPFQQLIENFEEQRMTTRQMRAVIWIMIKRSNPDYTFEDTRSLKVRDLAAIDTHDDDDASDTPLEVASG